MRSSSLSSRSACRDPLREPAAQRGHAEPLGARRAVKQLREVAQVRQSPLAVDAAAARRAGRSSPIMIASVSVGDAAVAQDPAPAVKPPVDLLPLALGSAVAIRSALQPKNGVSAAVCARERRGGPLDRLEQPQPVAGRGGREHAAGAVDHGRDARGLERVRAPARHGVGPDEDRDVAGADGVSSDAGPVALAMLDLRARGQQPDDVGGEVLARRARAPTARCADPSAVCSIAGSSRRTTRTRSGASAGRADQPSAAGAPGRP